MERERARNVFLCPDPHFKVHCAALDEENTDIPRISCGDAVYVEVQLREVGVERARGEVERKTAGRKSPCGPERVKLPRSR